MKRRYVNRAWVRSATIAIALYMAVIAQAQNTGGAAGAQGSQAQPLLGQNGPSAKLSVFVYPKNNQRVAQQQQDENECYAWARQQTATNPDVPPPAPQQAEKASGGGVRGAAGGAAGGAVIGAIAGDAGQCRPSYICVSYCRKSCLSALGTESAYEQDVCSSCLHELDIGRHSAEFAGCSQHAKVYVDETSRRSRLAGI
jgi:hypothetical protein